LKEKTWNAELKRKRKRKKYLKKIIIEVLHCSSYCFSILLAERITSFISHAELQVK
jgi:hypothetical protein